MDKYEKYREELPYSYVFGAFGTIELLKNKIDECLAVLIDPSFQKNDSFALIKQLADKKNIPLIINSNLINKIRDKGNIFVIGVFKKFHCDLSIKNHLALYEIDDIGLIGTIIRSMRGFNFENLVLINCKIDIFNEHLIRSTMGAFFSCNIKQFSSLEKYINDYPHFSFLNISSNGDKLDKLVNKENTSYIFSKNPINKKEVTNIKFEENISLDNIVNIVLFKLYN